MITIIYSEEYYDGNGMSSENYYEQFDNIELAKKWLEEKQAVNNFLDREEKIDILEILESKEISIELNQKRIDELTEERKLLSKKRIEKYEREKEEKEKKELERLKNKYEK